jgi:uncharacterized protein DUF4953/uncharacterized protein DUF5117
MLRSRSFNLLITSVLFAAALFAADTKPPATIHEFAANLKAIDGLFPLLWDAKTGHLYIQVSKFDQDFLFLPSLPYGLGSNDIGLDRGKLGEGRLVHFSHVGAKVLLIQPNLDYRSSSPNPAERIAVKQSFAESVLAGFKIEVEENGTVLIDATDFFLTDAFGVVQQLAAAKQGAYKVDKDRSSIVLDNTRNFPLNTEVESMLTFVTDKPAEKSLVATVAPDPYTVTLREHFSFVQLPEAGYTPRAFDPRSGYFDVMYRDYSAPLGSPIDLRFIARHRLQKKDRTLALSEPVKPIVYYVDRGAPEPIRSALVEGASWWAQAFEAAGFKNAFRVEVLPEDADPMDVRYNVIQWVHRSTRGWSYGAGIIDPRTGEIIKGQVTLGSLRARQDYLIAEALLSPYKKDAPVSPQLQAMVLARIRQLAAHEVGHTLGLGHNFVASAIAPGTSVMDYPHPWITLDANGHPDLSRAYAVGIGSWDKVSIQYGYTQFSSGTDEHAALDAILSSAQATGLYFITDQDSRPQGGAHPYSHLWDNGPDPAAELDRILTVRAAALEQFGENAIPMGMPMAQIEDTLVPLYLMHRYQTEAAAKEVGGLNYRYALRGDGQMITEIVTPANQRKALASLLKTISPATLTLSDSLLQILPPRPPGYPRTQESFNGRTGVTFDPQGAVEAATEITLGLLFDPQRASRLVEYNARDAHNPTLHEVIEAILSATWKAPQIKGIQGQVQRTTEMAVVEHLLGLAANQAAANDARAVARDEVVSLRKYIAGVLPTFFEQRGLQQAALARIDLFLKEPDKFTPTPPPVVPPGQPIGDVED